ncbi:hypothetical protein [Streptomyces hyderabadensis]|uniref:Uncharacterized protein n=1 Tax=Streptomyces hyderabadensis TaxID=598549 RepID=A0ABP9HMV7_9ACTN|nr:hypothetical protein [Streptomyces hyderabadensis]
MTSTEPSPVLGWGTAAHSAASAAKAATRATAPVRPFAQRARNRTGPRPDIDALVTTAEAGAGPCGSRSVIRRTDAPLAPQQAPDLPWTAPPRPSASAG